MQNSEIFRQDDLPGHWCYQQLWQVLAKIKSASVDAVFSQLSLLSSTFKFC